MSEEVQTTPMMLARIMRKLEEMNDRLVRLETRMVRLSEVQGINTKRQPAVFNNATNTVAIPTLDIGLRDLLDAIPVGLPGGAAIYHFGKAVGYIEKK